jgi:hypothetical protein
VIRRRARVSPRGLWWLAALSPAAAAACPACATRGEVQGAVALAVAAMIGAPLLVGGTLLWIAHRLERAR